MKNKWFHALLRKRFWIVLLLLLQVALLAYTVISTTLASDIVRWSMTAISIITCLYIIARKDKGGYKLTWVFVILVFPLFGGLIYLLFNFQMSSKRFSRNTAAAEAKAKKYLDLPGTAEKTACDELPQNAPQIHYLQNFAGFPTYADTETKYLTPGEEKFKYLLQELEKAEKYIFLEYFIVQEGVMWNAILEVLKEKAKQGVKVRLIYDDFGCFFLLPKDYPKRLKKYGIECVIFNKFKPFLTSIQNNRDHRKIVSIDGKVAFTGGINLADEYINAKEKHGHWKDASIMLRGKGAWSFTVMFLEMWELCTGEDEDYSEYYPWAGEACPNAENGFVQPYSDSPMDKENVGEHVYLQIINNAKKYVYINTPYLIIDDSMISALALAAKSGIDVRIVTPHIGDKWFVHTTTRSYYRELIGAGVKIYEYSKGFIHSKTFVSDDTVATVGTTNLDFRSLYLHFECGVCMYETSSVAEVRDDFLKTLDECQEITPRDCKNNPIRRAIQNIMRVFAPLM